MFLVQLGPLVRIVYGRFEKGLGEGVGDKQTPKNNREKNSNVSPFSSGGHRKKGTEKRPWSLALIAGIGRISSRQPPLTANPFPKLLNPENARGGATKRGQGDPPQKTVSDPPHLGTFCPPPPYPISLIKSLVNPDLLTNPFWRVSKNGLQGAIQFKGNRN